MVSDTPPDALADMTDAGYNPRMISPRSSKALAHSLFVFGDLSVIVYNAATGNLVGGHQRKQGLLESDLGNIEWGDPYECELGEADKRFTSTERVGTFKTAGGTVFAVRMVRWALAFEQAANLAANSPLLQGEWDFEKLTVIVPKLEVELPTLTVDLSFAELLPGGMPLVAEGETPEVQVEVVTELGDLWLMGEHRLVCGDCTEAATVERVLDGGMPFLCVTDPPYGVEYDPAWRNRAAAEGKLAYALRRIGEFAGDDRADWTAAWTLFPGDVLYSWHPAGATSMIHGAAIEAAGFDLRMQIIWAKPHFPIGRGDYHIRHEPCWYAVRKGKAAHRTKDRTQTTLWQIPLDRNVEGGHSTQKPVECMARPIRNHDAPEVYDPFLGSGTTLIACEQLARRCRAVELVPRYVDVAIRRWQNLTGGTAVNAQTEKTFGEVEAAKAEVHAPPPEREGSGETDHPGAEG